MSCFRIRGGRDFKEPLYISSVTHGGLADISGLRTGMHVLSIGRDPTDKMTHQQALQAIIRCCNDLELEVYDNGSHNYSDFTPIHKMNTFVTQSSLNIELNKPRESPKPQTIISKMVHIGTSPIISRSHSPNGTTIRSYSSNSATVHDRVLVKNVHIDCTSPVYTPQKDIRPLHSSINNQYLHNTINQPMPNMQIGTKLDNPHLKRGIRYSQNSRINPICYVCQQQIHGPFIDTNDRCFCPNHFICDICHRQLNEDGFAEQNGKLYCEKDFEQFIAYKCAKCHLPVIGKITKALNQTWHPYCFICHQCHKPLDDLFYVEDDNRVLCEEHWKQLHETECAKCKQPISEIDRFIQACGKQYHAKCFSCAACQTLLEGKPFHTRNQKPFCLIHANAVALFG
ncbi:hypothetical protein MN116_006839 [Schistosoma mekongi]|uniref:LIM domain-containing protein n=1 Tax=Schistosoma mekongi TaxID=38744 RepID=A0AAE2D2W3_SCHME|nr:hypothetical protein MN116_006839 [Schistosoma mekongi]